jgi:hypothetical protein
MIATNLNSDQLKLRPGAAPGETNPRQPPRHRPGEWFLKGPIPWNWLTIAAQLPGKALHLGIAIWFLSAVKRSRVIKLSPSILATLGVSRYAAYRALLTLEKAGLILVERHLGRKSVVTLVGDAAAKSSTYG